MYTLYTEAFKRIIFRDLKSSEQILNIFVIVGFLMVVLPFVFYFIFQTSFPSFLRAVVSIGALFILIGASNRKKAKNMYPTEIILNLESAQIEVVSQNKECTQLPLSDIKKVIVKEKRVSTKSSSSTTKYTYFLTLVFSDSSEWELVQYNDSKVALNYADEISEKINKCINSVTYVPSSIPEMPNIDGLLIEKDSSKTRLISKVNFWRSISIYIVTVFVIGFVIKTIAEIVLIDHDDASFAFFVLGFITLLFIIIIAINFVKIIKEYGCVHLLEVFPEGVRYAFVSNNYDKTLKEYLYLKPQVQLKVDIGGDAQHGILLHSTPCIENDKPKVVIGNTLEQLSNTYYFPLEDVSIAETLKVKQWLLYRNSISEKKP